jgi:hypothetical protein
MMPPVKYYYTEFRIFTFAENYAGGGGGGVLLLLLLLIVYNTKNYTLSLTAP